MPIIEHLQQHKILLDTHIWIWTMFGEPFFKSSFLSALDLSREREGILISAITIWEIGMLVEKNRLALEMDCLDWVEQALMRPGVKLVPISPKIAIESVRLPGEIHGDPADRLLIATAHHENAVLVTCDQKILEYGRDRYTNVHDPRKI